MRRVIIISQNLPPVKNIATVRITEVANQFVKNGYEVVGLSSFNYKIEGTDKYLLDPSIVIHRIDSWDFLVLRQAFRQKARKKNAQQQIEQQQKVVSSTPGKAKSKITGFVANYLPFSLIFGAGNIFYILRTFFKVLKFCKNDTVIFSSFRPFSDHLIAYLVKLFRPGVFWICDFRDPYIPPNSINIFFKFHNWFNKQICRRANVVTTVSNGVARNLTGYNKNIDVLRNGIVGSMQTSSPLQNGDKFCITYTGGLYEGVRNPTVLFQTVSNLLAEGKLRKENFQLVYAGPDKTIWDHFINHYRLGAINCSYGMLSMDESRQLQQSATVNLLLTWADRNYKGVLTGKMYEYFRVGKPVITIINGDRDEEIESIMQQTNAGPVVYSNGENEKVLSEFILELYNDYISGKPMPTINQEVLERFRWDIYFPGFLKELGLLQTETQSAYAL